jgi:hypothetical protein
MSEKVLLLISALQKKKVFQFRLTPCNYKTAQSEIHERDHIMREELIKVP